MQKSAVRWAKTFHRILISITFLKFLLQDAAMRTGVKFLQLFVVCIYLRVICFFTIPNFFHQMCCLFWNPQNCVFVWETKCTVEFRSNHLFLSLMKKPKKSREKPITNKQFIIRENKIREIISWADHMNSLKGLNITTHPCTVQIWTGTVGRFYQCQLFKNSIREHQSHFIKDAQEAYFEPKKLLKKNYK